MRTCYFEVGTKGATVYVASKTADPAVVKAAALERLAELGMTDVKPKDLTIFMSKGMTPSAFAKRWVGNITDLDEQIELMRRDNARYPEFATPLTPAGLRIGDVLA